jgi:hypothetical protein
MINAPRISACGHTYYRGFRIMPQANGVLFVRWMSKHVNYYLPRFFEFRGTVEDCCKYCDALIDKRIWDSKKYEDHGMATGQTFEPEQVPGPIVSISPNRLLAVMLGLDPMCVPAAATIHFTSHKGRHWADFIPAELVAEGVLPDIDMESLKTSLTASAASIPDYQHTGLNVPRPVLVEETKIEEQKIQEINIASFDREYYQEQISLIASNPPYYCRRLTKGSDLIYMATSWSKDGPWTVVSCDKERCMVLGIKVAA